MKIFARHIKEKKGTEITNYVGRTTWTGSVVQASRTVELDILNAPNDKNIKNNIVRLGDIISITIDGKNIFYGQVTNKEKKSDTGTITYTARDLAFHLLQSKITRKFKNMTPEKIAELVCKEMKIKTGNLAKTGLGVKKVIAEERSIYETIMFAYTKAAKENGKKYMLRMDKDELEVIEKGKVISNYELSEDYNVTSSSYQESIEEMVNQVVIVDSKKKKIGIIKNDKQIEKYGLFQEVYEKEKGVNCNSAAKKLLNGVQKDIEMEIILPTVKCIAGNGITVKDKATGLKGIFYIQNDTHTWENGVWTARLGLTFKNLMDKQEDDEEEGTKKKKGSSKKEHSLSAKAWYTIKGEKYHSNSKCGNMKSPVETTVKRAIKKGKEKCSRCWK